MGCAGTKSEMTPEEALIIKGESRLLYQEHSAVKVDMAYRKYSKGGFVNENQWKDISKFLNLAIYNDSTPKAIQDFYTSLKTDNKYSLRDLLVLGIYLSSGNPTDKVRLLFEAYDSNNDKILNKTHLQQLASFLVDLAVEKTYALIPHEEGEKVSQENLNSFIQRLRGAKNKGKNELLKVFMGGDLTQDSVNMEKFVENLTTPSTITLLTLPGIRDFLKKQEITSSKFAALTALKKNNPEQKKPEGK
ncbi:hypothetical protein SteCoe_27642 [Stentor coeruleus]|uniref:EF-hand domain-containing protein n=1 Tax=Stentor coeruleus TaxID=5963 RepID=A0A1R2BAB1_9CILI|nr:hypothetical protein SteCoe_27642 [Stentor coeruleus]